MCSAAPGSIRFGNWRQHHRQGTRGSSTLSQLCSRFCFRPGLPQGELAIGFSSAISFDLIGASGSLEGSSIGLENFAKTTPVSRHGGHGWEAGKDPDDFCGTP